MTVTPRMRRFRLIEHRPRNTPREVVVEAAAARQAVVDAYPATHRVTAAGANLSGTWWTVDAPMGGYVTVHAQPLPDLPTEGA